MVEPSAVPFFDLSGMNEEVSAATFNCWRTMVSEGDFIGGRHLARFEADWARYCGTKYCVGVANGTDALALVLRALGIGPGDEVIVPTNTFIATAEAIALVGAIPRFVDVDPDTLLVRADIVESAITPRTAAIIPVHLYGHMPDMDAIALVAARAGVALVEDAAQAHGASWNGKEAGSFGVAGCFSFYPGKNLGAFGDGGAIVTDDADLASRLRSLGNHGRSEASKYLHSVLGTNSRLDALQAAVLSAKLRRLDAWNAARRAAVAQYQRLLDASGVSLVEPLAGSASVYHLNVARVPNRDHVREVLARAGIETQIHYPVPCHQQGAFQRDVHEPLPVAEQAATQILSLPLWPSITPTQVGTVCERLSYVVREEVADVS